MIRRIRDYPRELQVGESIYSIRFVRRIPDEPKDTVGLCDDGDKMIWIRLGQTPRERWKTLTHEIAHALEAEYQIKIPHKLIYRLEEPIARLLEDNL